MTVADGLSVSLRACGELADDSGERAFGPPPGTPTRSFSRRAQPLLASAVDTSRRKLARTIALATLACIEHEHEASKQSHPKWCLFW
jgi:hypothetical protein